MTPRSLHITEIFYSLQGESRTAGWPTTFVRLTGCPLRCSYCDTAYAFSGGEVRLLEEIMAEVAGYPARHVTVTGGEPLAQPACLELLTCLLDRGYEVSLETSGALDISQVDPRVLRVVDLKTPSSGECHRNLQSNLALLGSNDELKLVIAGRGDYEWARQQLLELELNRRCPVIFSPAMGSQDATELAEWILQDGLDVRFQMQLHKLLWGDARGK